MRVLLVAGSLRFGGSEKVLVQILQRLDRSAFEPHLALLAREGQFLDRVPNDVPIHSIGANRARMASLPVARLCWKLRPQVVISFAAHLNAAVLIAKGFLPARTKVVIREGANITLPEVASAFSRAIYRMLYRRADAVISQSDDMSERLRKAFRLSPQRLFRIHNSVDGPAIEHAARGSSPYQKKGPHLVFVGRLAWIKGPDLLIRAMPYVLKQSGGAMLTVVGDGPLRRDLNVLADSLGLKEAVRFVGYQENPLPCIRYADAVVIPSRSEAFSNVALEALSLGTPVIATDCPGGMHEIARHTTRMRLSPIDPATLAKTILTALSDFRSSERIPEPEFLTEFSPAGMIQAYEEVISGITRRSASTPGMEHLELTTR